MKNSARRKLTGKQQLHADANELFDFWDTGQAWLNTEKKWKWKEQQTLE